MPINSSAVRRIMKSGVASWLAKDALPALA